MALSKEPLDHWFTPFVQSKDSFRNQTYGFIQKPMLLTDAQKFCGGFIGNIFIDKIEKKTNILFKI